MFKKLFVLVLVLGLASTVMADIRGHWALDGDATDTSGYGNHGTAQNTPTPTTDRFGNPNSAMAFDGTTWANDAFDVGNDVSVQISGAMTITAWVYLDSTLPAYNTQNARILSKLAIPGGVDWSYSMNIEKNVGGVTNPATFIVGLPENAGIINIVDDETLPTDRWVHFASVYRPGESMEIYLDGKLAAIRTDDVPASQYSSGTGHLFIGSFQGGADVGWTGALDDIYLYSDALTAEQIAEIGYEQLPSPADGATNIALNTDLSWNIPIDANEISWTYEVYIDTDSTFASTTPVTAGPLAAGEKRVTVTNAQISGPLSVGTYYWRADSIDPNLPAGTPKTHTGDIWTFAAGATLPTLISPADTYDPTVEIDVDLEWSSDPLVTASKVIITPDGGSPIDLGKQTSPFNPWADAGIAMQWDTKYTWHVEELDAGDNTLAVGLDWVFQVRALTCVGMNSDIDGSGDCIVNLADFAMMASEWLDCNWDDGGKTSPCP